MRVGTRTHLTRQVYQYNRNYVSTNELSVNGGDAMLTTTSSSSNSADWARSTGTTTATAEGTILFQFRRGSTSETQTGQLTLSALAVGRVVPAVVPTYASAYPTGTNLAFGAAMSSNGDPLTSVRPLSNVVDEERGNANGMYFYT